MLNTLTDYEGLLKGCDNLSEPSDYKPHPIQNPFDKPEVPSEKGGG